MSDELREFYSSCAIPKPYRAPKPPRRIRVKAKPQAERDHVTEVRDYVRGRERGRCRCCRKRPGESMHELRPRSLGGKVSRTNSVWVCGDGVRGCHGLLQRREVRVLQSHGGAEHTLIFEPTTRAAEDWLGIKIGDCLISDPMRIYED